MYYKWLRWCKLQINHIEQTSWLFKVLGFQYFNLTRNNIFSSLVIALCRYPRTWKRHGGTAWHTGQPQLGCLALQNSSKASDFPGYNYWKNILYSWTCFIRVPQSFLWWHLILYGKQRIQLFALTWLLKYVTTG